MTGKIKGLKFDYSIGAIIELAIDDKSEALNIAEKYQNDIIDISICKHREKRSLDANNYAWVLIRKLAENQNLNNYEVYRHYIRENGVYRQIEVSCDAVKTLTHVWQSNGIGWICEEVDYSKHDGFKILNLFYGSSVYNSKQMSRLIDSIVQDCKAVGIETLPPYKISELIKEWGNEKHTAR